MAWSHGTTVQKGYDAAHEAERKRWAPHVAAGQANCHATRCLHRTRRIHPGQRWDLGHTPDRTTWTGPEHMRCNRSAGGRNGARVTHALHRARTQTRRLPIW